jgi:hypothetical protein
VVIIPCDENATINPRTLPAALSGFRPTYPVLYPLAVGRLSTWPARMGNAVTDAPADIDT